MPATPRISVLMAVYNGAPFLHQSIGSILNQDCADWEFVIIDDASTDETPELLASYARDRRIRLFRNNRNLGLAKSLNRGLDVVRGEFIARIDADDVNAPSRLRRQLVAMEQDPRLVLLGSRANSLHEETGLVEPRIEPLGNVEIRVTICGRNPFPHSSVFLRRSVLVQHGLRYDETYPAAQDYELWTRVMEHGRVMMLSNMLVTYRWHPMNVTATRFEEQQELAAKAARDYMRRVAPESRAADIPRQRLRMLVTGHVFPSRDEVRCIRGLYDGIGQNAFVQDKELRGAYMAWASGLLECRAIRSICGRTDAAFLLRSCRRDAWRYLVDRGCRALMRRLGTAGMRE